MNKKIKAYVKLQLEAGKANPSPPVGPSLGQHGINIMDFCKEFNKKTNKIEKGLLTPVIITIYSDRTFSFIIKTTPASVLLKKVSGIKVGSSHVSKKKVGKISKEQIYEIAKIKSVDMTGSDINAVMRTIEGTAKSIGLEIID